MIDIRKLLNRKVIHYNTLEFIALDPISIPHRYVSKEDIEISGFLTALISWGRRDLILKSAMHLMTLMDNQPFEFVMKASPRDLKRLSTYYYRTFNADDLLFLVEALKDIYNEGGLEGLAKNGYIKTGTIKGSILEIRKKLLQYPHLRRSEKHLANPEAGSAVKRINMFLRWMVRNNETGVDFALWKTIPSSALMCPLDVHSGRMARQLGLLLRNQNDWKAVEELTDNLRKLDPDDPVKYDFALFGMGVNEAKFKR